MAVVISRRALLRTGALAAGTAVVSPLYRIADAAAPPQTPSSTADALAVRRAQLAAVPIETMKLTNVLTLFSGPGGNVIVRNGEEGKVIVDTFVQGAFKGLKARIDAMSDAPIVLVINTHWHFDHTDNNENFQEAGVPILAHENTKRRLTESHDILGMHFEPVPAAALPTETFVHTHEVKFEISGNEEYLDIGSIPSAHTDSDIFVRFVIGDVLHLGDAFFNGMYPVIDGATGGRIDGLVAAADTALKAVNPQTRVVPGHGPVGDRAALTKYRDMLVDVRERVQKLKAAGRSEQDVVSAKPTARFDDEWGRGVVPPDAFVSMIYNTL